MEHRLRVLLVEDDLGDANLLLMVLKGTTSPLFAVIHEQTLSDAIDRIGTSAAFDVALLDLNLPDASGIQSLAGLQAAAPTMPIIIMTGLDDPEFAEEALNSGAQDYLVKGEASKSTVVRAIRYAISRKHADLERQAMADRLAADCERLEENLQMARSMEFDLLPRQDLLDRLRQSHGLAIDGYFEPSFDVGGDLWGCIDADHGCLAVFIFDFSGHGLGAALNVFRLHALLSAGDKLIADPASTLDHLNRTLVSILPRGQYATIFLGLIDPARETLTWAAGGAPPPILFSGQATPCLLDTCGKPLGLSAEAVYVNRAVAFPRGSSLFLYSDAMVESRTGNDEMLGETGLLEMVQPLLGGTGIDIPELVENFTGVVGSPLDDDMTAVCITLLAEAPRGQPKVATAAAAPLILTSWQCEAAATGLSSPYHGFLEITEAGLADVGRGCFDAVEQGGICLSLSTRSAYHCDMAGLLSAAARRRFPGKRDWEAVDIAIAEAVGNAIIHGNLGIMSSLRETLSGLDRYAEAVVQHLNDTASAGKRVEAAFVRRPDGHLELAVHDRGAGFDIERRLEARPPSGNTHGRGLALMVKVAQTVAWRDGGRTVVLTL